MAAIHMQASDTISQRPLCSTWVGGGWYPPGNLPATDDAVGVTCQRCQEVLAQLVEGNLGNTRGRKRHFENSQGKVLCRDMVVALGDMHFATTRIFDAVTCKTCRSAIIRITTRAQCSHAYPDRTTAFIAGGASDVVALCATCGAVIMFSTCKSCWGKGCGSCGGVGVFGGPRCPGYETAKITEL